MYALQERRGDSTKRQLHKRVRDAGAPLQTGTVGMAAVAISIPNEALPQTDEV